MGTPKTSRARQASASARRSVARERGIHRTRAARRQPFRPNRPACGEASPSIRPRIHDTEPAMTPAEALSAADSHYRRGKIAEATALARRALALQPADIQIQSDYGAVDTDARFNPRTFDLLFSDMVWTDAQDRASELHRLTHGVRSGGAPSQHPAGSGQRR